MFFCVALLAFGGNFYDDRDVIVGIVKGMKTWITQILVTHLRKTMLEFCNRRS